MEGINPKSGYISLLSIPFLYLPLTSKKYLGVVDVTVLNALLFSILMCYVDLSYFAFCVGGTGSILMNDRCLRKT